MSSILTEVSDKPPQVVSSPEKVLECTTCDFSCKTEREAWEHQTTMNRYVQNKWWKHYVLPKRPYRPPYNRPVGVKRVGE